MRVLSTAGAQQSVRLGTRTARAHCLWAEARRGVRTGYVQRGAKLDYNYLIKKNPPPQTYIARCAISIGSTRRNSKYACRRLRSIIITADLIMRFERPVTLAKKCLSCIVGKPTRLIRLSVRLLVNNTWCMGCMPPGVAEFIAVLYGNAKRRTVLYWLRSIR